MSDFIEVKNQFSILVHDYYSGSDYSYQQSFDSYEDCREFIKTYDFDSVFNSHPLGFSIIELPKLDCEVKNELF